MLCIRGGKGNHRTRTLVSRIWWELSGMLLAKNVRLVFWNRNSENFRTLLWSRYSYMIHDWKLEALYSYALLMQIFFITSMLYYRTKKVKSGERYTKKIVLVIICKEWG